MIRPIFWAIVAGLVVGCLTVASGQPRLQVEKPSGYQVGERIEKEVTVLDKDLQPQSLVSLIKPETKVLVLVGFGGIAARVPEGKFRGPLWCEDSFDDLAVQRALVAAFRHSPVQFIGVAVPPVYNPSAFGYSKNSFLGYSDTSPEFLADARQFVTGTEEQVARKLIPFDQVFYDLKYRLGDKPSGPDATAGYGEIQPWQSKLKWHLDPRKYGLPIIWLIGPKGEVLQEPFFSNDYDSDPPQIMYQFQDLKAAIEKYLADR
ncbi:MAG: hypothetical protein EHM61_05975 [Acidobacteria bacterium]|nr:MAG: hypothetical protein EHM61_05975 [Acidobacteriota bacterium]